MAMRVKKQKPNPPVKNRDTGPSGHDFTKIEIRPVFTESVNGYLNKTVLVCRNCGLAKFEFHKHPKANCRVHAELPHHYRRGIK